METITPGECLESEKGLPGVQHLEDIEPILKKTLDGDELGRAEILSLLKTRERDQLEALFRTAREVRGRFFGNRVYLYGFLYTSTYCRNNCSYCFYRAGNLEAPRYRKPAGDVLAAAESLTRSGVHLVDITMGEDPHYFQAPGGDFSELLRLVGEVHRRARLPVMVSPGVVSAPVLAQLARAGASWYACYQETHNPRLFSKLRPGQGYEARLEARLHAHEAGLLVEDGILSGVGESYEDLVQSIIAMKALGTDQVRVMNFVPQPGTPMASVPPPDPLREWVTLAVLRLVFPGGLVPATLDVAGLEGLGKRLAAGANVVTSLVPPGQGLAGVAQSSLDIDNARRTVAGVQPVLEECGLEVASRDSYIAWIRERRKVWGEALHPGEVL